MSARVIVITTALAASVAVSAPAQPRASVRALLQQARAHAAAGNAPLALDALRKARTVAPNAEEVLSAFAQVSLTAQLPVQAIDVLEPLTRICPDVAEYHYLLGVAYLQAGGMAEAVDALREADRLEPDRVTTLVALGLALNSRKLFGDAEPLLRRALTIEHENPDVLAALAETEEGLGDPDGAETHAARALAAAPTHATAHYVIGLLRMKQQRYVDARDALLRAIEAEPHLARAHYQVSLAYARLGDEARSRKHAELSRRSPRTP